LTISFYKKIQNMNKILKDYQHYPFHHF